MTPIQSANQIEDNFAKEMLKLQEKWPRLSPSQRLKEVQAIVNNFSKANGFSKEATPKIIAANLPPGFAASYDSTKNSTLINKLLFIDSKKSLSNAEINGLAADLRHELEHAKDARKVANLLANELAEGKYVDTTGKKKAILTTSNIVLASTARVNFAYPDGSKELFVTSLSPAIAQQAVNDYNRKVRLKVGSPERIEAEQLRNASYTAQGLNQRTIENYTLIQAAASGNQPAYNAASRAHDANRGEIGAERVEEDMRQRMERVRSRTKTNSEKGSNEKTLSATNISQLSSSENQNLTTLPSEEFSNKETSFQKTISSSVNKTADVTAYENEIDNHNQIDESTKSKSTSTQEASSDETISSQEIDNDLTSRTTSTAPNNSDVTLNNETTTNLPKIYEGNNIQENNNTNVSKVVELLRQNRDEVIQQYGLDVSTHEGLGKAVMQYWKENKLDPKLLKDQLPQVSNSEFEAAFKQVNTIINNVSATKDKQFVS
jgi:hypothetical protein